MVRLLVTVLNYLFQYPIMEIYWLSEHPIILVTVNILDMSMFSTGMQMMTNTRNKDLTLLERVIMTIQDIRCLYLMMVMC